MADLLALVKQRHFVTSASQVRPQVDYVTEEETGFVAGKHPLYFTAYDKLREQRKNYDRLYFQALIDRRWGGTVPELAARLEFQLCRPWLPNHGIDSPEDFLNRRGKLAAYLTEEWFRLTMTRVYPKQKHQSRAQTHPLWTGIQHGMAAIFGPPEGTLAPIEREKITPLELALQGRGCLANCLLQMGIEFHDYLEFVKSAGLLLFRLFPDPADREKFLKAMAERRMDYEVS